MADGKRVSYGWALFLLITLIGAPTVVGVHQSSWHAAMLALLVTPFADVVVVWVLGFLAGMVIAHPVPAIAARPGRPAAPAAPAAPVPAGPAPQPHGGPDPALIERLAQEFDLPNPTWQQFETPSR